MKPEWQLVENQWAGRNEPNYWVQRAGYAVRERDADPDAAPETRYGMHFEEDGENLVVTLNQLDAMIEGWETLRSILETINKTILIMGIAPIYSSKELAELIKH